MFMVFLVASGIVLAAHSNIDLCKIILKGANGTQKYSVLCQISIYLAETSYSNCTKVWKWNSMSDCQQLTMPHQHTQRATLTKAAIKLSLSMELFMYLFTVWNEDAYMEKKIVDFFSDWIKYREINLHTFSPRSVRVAWWLKEVLETGVSCVSVKVNLHKPPRFHLMTRNFFFFVITQSCEHISSAEKLTSSPGSVFGAVHNFVESALFFVHAAHD